MNIKDVKGLQVRLCILVVMVFIKIMQDWAAADGHDSKVHADYTVHMQDGMYTQWDERLVADFVTDAARDISPTMVSPCWACHCCTCFKLAVHQHSLSLYVLSQIVSFDAHGVSGHANHRAVHRGLL